MRFYRAFLFLFSSSDVFLLQASQNDSLFRFVCSVLLPQTLHSGCKYWQINSSIIPNNINTENNNIPTMFSSFSTIYI